MHLTRPQQRLIDTMHACRQLVHVHQGGGWRLFDGTPVHYRTAKSLVRAGILTPVAHDLFGEQPIAYRLAETTDHIPKGVTP